MADLRSTLSIWRSSKDNLGAKSSTTHPKEVMKLAQQVKKAPLARPLVFTTIGVVIGMLIMNSGKLVAYVMVFAFLWVIYRLVIKR